MDTLTDLKKELILKKEPIVQYTSDEKEMLLSDLEHRDGSLILTKACIEFHEVTYIIDFAIIYKIFKNDINGVETNNFILINELIDLILHTELDDVPMSMNILPQIAKWRLRIGK